MLLDVGGHAGPSELRLGELLAALSLATDLGNGFPLEKALRNCLLATRLGEQAGLAGAELSDVYYVSMLRFIGCTAFTHEMAGVYGDDIKIKNTYAAVDFGVPKDIVKTIFTQVGKGEGAARRAKLIATEMTKGRKLGAQMIAADCEVAMRLCGRLRLGAPVARGIGHMFERWDGKGMPSGAKGVGIELTARLLHVAHESEIHSRLFGRDAARAFIRRGSGGWFDPAIAEAFLGRSDDLLAEIEAESVWDAAIDAEPEPRLMLRESELDEICRAFADFADLKSGYHLGHSSGVAELAESAARVTGLSEADVVTVRRAGYLHDLGRVSVPSGIWNKPGKLTAAEWERVRLHSYYSERVLSQTPLLTSIARIAGLHHERLDGSGYHRNAQAAMLPAGARILAAADVYHALIEPRPHREAFPSDVAAKELESIAGAGLLDRDAVAAVCEAAGHRQPGGKRTGPAGLTEREVEVLRLIARGASKKEVAGALTISPATAHTHVVHIYSKIGVSTRAGAALFAMENGLIGP